MTYNVLGSGSDDRWATTPEESPDSIWNGDFGDEESGL